MKYIEDTFTGPDGTGLAAHVPDINLAGGVWNPIAGVWTLQGNKAVTTSVAQARAIINGAIADGRLKADIVIGAVAQSASLVFRSNAAGTNFLAVRLNQAAPQLELYTVTALVPTVVTTVTYTLDWATEYELKIEFYGDELRILIDDLPILSHTSALYNTQQYFGIYATTNATATFDNFMLDDRPLCLYCTTADVKAKLGEQWTSGTKYDEMLEDAIEEASRSIDDELGWGECHFSASDPAPITRYYDGVSDTEIQIDRFLDDASFAVAVDEDLDGVYTPWTRDTDYIVWPRNADHITQIEIKHDATVYFTEGQEVVQVTGRLGGYSEPPATIRKACCIMVAKAFKRGMQAYQDTGAIEELGELRYVLAIDPEVDRILKNIPRRGNFG